MCEMQILWEVDSLFVGYATQFIIWAYAIISVIMRTQDNRLSEGLQKIFQMIIKMTELFWSEGYCYFLGFPWIAYYPVTNHFSSYINGPRFPEVGRQLISIFGNNETREITGISVRTTMFIPPK